MENKIGFSIEAWKWSFLSRAPKSGIIFLRIVKKLQIWLSVKSITYLKDFFIDRFTDHVCRFFIKYLHLFSILFMSVNFINRNNHGQKIHLIENWYVMIFFLASWVSWIFWCPFCLPSSIFKFWVFLSALWDTINLDQPLFLHMRNFSYQKTSSIKSGELFFGVYFFLRKTVFSLPVRKI